MSELVEAHRIIGWLFGIGVELEQRRLLLPHRARRRALRSSPLQVANEAYKPMFLRCLQPCFDQLFGQDFVDVPVLGWKHRTLLRTMAVLVYARSYRCRCRLTWGKP